MCTPHLVSTIAMGLTIWEQWPWAFSENNSCSPLPENTSCGSHDINWEQWLCAFSENNSCRPSKRAMAMVLTTPSENSGCGPSQRIIAVALTENNSYGPSSHYIIWEQWLWAFSENNSCSPSQRKIAMGLTAPFENSSCGPPQRTIAVALYREQ